MRLRSVDAPALSASGAPAAFAAACVAVAAVATGLAGYVGASWFLAFFGGPLAAFAILRSTVSTVMVVSVGALVVVALTFAYWTWEFFTALEGAR